jgi:hypothetical protein
MYTHIHTDTLSLAPISSTKVTNAIMGMYRSGEFTSSRGGW